MIDILVNNAGIVYYKSIIDTTEEKWDTIDINLKGVFLFTKKVLSYMIENKSGVQVLENMVSQTYLHIVQASLV
jgi:NADP-dependent 3-hydroxy acid dehydrogenase YdfG